MGPRPQPKGSHRAANGGRSHGGGRADNSRGPTDGDNMMNGWFIFNSRFSDVGADLHITAHVCGSTGTGADQGHSSQ